MATKPYREETSVFYSVHNNRSYLVFVTLNALREGTALKLDGEKLAPDSLGLYEVPVGERTLVLEHPLFKTETREIAAETRQQIRLDWLKPTWRVGSFSIADLPAGTRLVLLGDNGFRYEWVQAGNGRFAASEALVIGDYSVALDGPYIDPCRTSVAIREDSESVLSPAFREYGIVEIRAATPVPLSVQLQDTASGKVLDYPTDGPGLRIERGGYRVLSRRASDIAPAAAQEIEVDARSTKAVVLADPGESLASRYQRAKLDYDFARRSAERSIKTRRSLRTIGWTMLGIGAGSGGLAAYSYFDGLEKYEQYVNNPFSSSMDDYRERAQDASRLFSAALSIGIGSLVSGVILQVVAPNPARVQGEAEDRRRILEGLADEYRALPAYLKASEMLE